ncbi:MAG: hypothetical protein Q4D66_02245 [Bacteroidales bacterium]|nr:hypothetical protein [Bacteroidales bacterium]
MDVNQKLLKSAVALVQLMNKTADQMLPEDIVGVIKQHSVMAVASAWIPVPGADVAAGAATMWGMYLRINSKLGLPFAENVIKSVGSGVATNLAGYAVGMGVASALKFIPVIGSIGGGIVMSATLYALTMASGYVYLQALLYLAQNKGTSFKAEDIQGAITHVLKNKAVIKEFVDAAKKSYKK